MSFCPFFFLLLKSFFFFPVVLSDYFWLNDIASYHLNDEKLLKRQKRLGQENVCRF